MRSILKHPEDAARVSGKGFDEVEGAQLTFEAYTQEEIDAEWARLEALFLEMERKEALAAGRPFDPNAEDVRERVSLAVVEDMDDGGWFDGCQMHGDESPAPV